MSERTSHEYAVILPELNARKTPSTSSSDSITRRKNEKTDNDSINTMTIEVWYKLNDYEVDAVELVEGSKVRNLRKAVKEEWSNTLKGVDSGLLKVFAAGADPNTDDHLDPGDLLKDVANDTTSKKALIVVAQRADLLQPAG